MRKIHPQAKLANWSDQDINSISDRADLKARKVFVGIKRRVLHNNEGVKFSKRHNNPE